MAYPSTKIIWDDQSDITTIAAETTDTVDRPVFFTAFSSDKGPEEFQNGIKSDTFFKLFGDKPSFYKHGQTLIQAAKIVDAGGKLFCKRIVAEDATLANIGVVANVFKVNVQKTDENGNPIYTNGTIETTDPVGTTPVMVQKCRITFSLQTVNISGNSITSMASAFLSDFAHTKNIGEDDSYPLFLISDNGRGISNKKIRIYSDASSTRPVNYVKYYFEVIENGIILETIPFTMNPDIIEDEENISLQTAIQSYSTQLRCRIFEDEINAFMENVAYIAGIDEDELFYADVLFGSNLYGASYDELIYDGTVSMDTVNGISLLSGSNGLFGDRPITASTYTSELIKVFNGTAGDEIYDLDNSRMDVVFDANWPAIVKRAIENLVTFREDMMYFRDMGLGIASIAELKIANTDNFKSRFCATYHNSWDVKDPYTRKQITVTCMYSLCSKFVKHFLNGRSRPFCGQLYEITLSDSEVIKGTINFIPKNTPSVDQKQVFDDLKINYCSYYSGVLTLETEYTSQTRYTQLSWLSNVLLVQELVKEIRVKCPKIRYNFMSGDGLTNYQNDVNAILSSYSSKFESIEMVYTKDKQYEHNKIFYAYIKVYFKDFVQSETFKITALIS